MIFPEEAMHTDQKCEDGKHVRIEFDKTHPKHGEIRYSEDGKHDALVAILNLTNIHMNRKRYDIDKGFPIKKKNQKAAKALVQRELHLISIAFMLKNI
jgi:hypothetical protein